jgi:predicted DNA-binding transcriptional regulator YafY
MEIFMKIERLIGILSILLQQDKITASELAEKFEVSVRTILRDIDEIARAGIPIVTSQGQGGGISIMDGYKIDRTLLSSAEMTAIFAGLKSLDSVSGTNRYRQLMDKLSVSDTVNADNHIIIDLSMWDKNAVAEKIELIKSAIEQNRIITYKYYSPQRIEQRSIEPYRLIFQWSSWYVWGFCTKRQDYRMFKLTRMTELKCTDEAFVKREIPEYSCDKLRHTRGEITAEVKFDKSVKWRIIDEFGRENFNEDAEGNIILNFTWADKQSFFSYILGFRECAEIISPAEYREEFLELLKNIYDKYVERIE